MSDTSGLVTATDLNTNISEVCNKISDTSSSLVTTTVFNAKNSEVENKILDHAKYITIPQFNKLNAENMAARLKNFILKKHTINIWDVNIDDKVISKLVESKLVLSIWLNS